MIDVNSKRLNSAANAEKYRTGEISFTLHPIELVHEVSQLHSDASLDNSAKVYSHKKYLKSLYHNEHISYFCKRGFHFSNSSTSIKGIEMFPKTTK